MKRKKKGKNPRQKKKKKKTTKAITNERKKKNRIQISFVSLQRLAELNENHPDLRGDLRYSLDLLQAIYYDALSKPGPFTIFVPINRAFRKVASDFLVSAMSFVSLCPRPFLSYQLSFIRCGIGVDRLTVRMGFSCWIMYILMNSCKSLMTPR